MEDAKLIDWKKCFEDGKHDFDRASSINLTDKVECMEDLGLIDPLSDDKENLTILIRTMTSDKFESKMTVFFTNGWYVNQFEGPKLCTFLPSEGMSRKIICALSAHKDEPL